MSNGTHPINGLMDSSLQNLRSLIDANTVIGEAITTPDGTMIIPVSRVSFGFASGGTDVPTTKVGEPFGGGAGGGVSVQPIAFLIIKDGKVDLMQISESKNTADRVVNMMPGMVDKISAIFNKDSKTAKTATEPEPEL